jgi:hypothetical protein
MKQTRILALGICMLVSLPVSAQTGSDWQFRWQKGQVLAYRVDHNTSVSEVIGGNKVESSSKLHLSKRWQVAEVDAKGNATLNLSLVALRHEQTRPNGEVLLFDSADLEKSTPELKEQMSQFIGKTLTSIRIDALGRVLEVLQGPANRYESEPPLVLVLPEQPVQQGQSWQRSFQVTLDPPLGTGEKFPATQTYQLTKLADSKATLALTTQFKLLPENLADRVPLLQKQPEGQVVFDVQTGQLISAQLVIDQTLENHQGEGSSYRFQSQYTEQLVPVP